MTGPTGPTGPDIAVRRFTENGCAITCVIVDPGDRQTTMYATVTRDGRLVGSYHPAHPNDPTERHGWTILAATGAAAHATTETGAMIALITT